MSQRPRRSVVQPDYLRDYVTVPGRDIPREVVIGGHQGEPTTVDPAVALANADLTNAEDEGNGLVPPNPNLPQPQEVQGEVPQPNHPLPPLACAKDCSNMTWGCLSGQDIIYKLETIYTKVVKWRPNLFKLPSGAAGKSFVTEVKRLMDAWTNKTNIESYAILALTIFIPVMLQKPSRTSKNSAHIRYLTKRLNLWAEGELDTLVSECVAIQNRLQKVQHKPDHNDKVFAKLMLEGKVTAALRWVTDNTSKPLPLSDDIISALQAKHPQNAPVSVNHLLVGPVPHVEPVIFDNIDGELIYKMSKTVKGSHGPSGASSDMWKRALCSKSLGNASKDLCDSLALFTHRLCTEFVDPSSTQSLLNCCLVPLDKNPGMRPIGIGDGLRRIVGKVVTTLLKPEIVTAVGPLQLSAGQSGGC